MGLTGSTAPHAGLDLGLQAKEILLIKKGILGGNAPFLQSLLQLLKDSRVTWIIHKILKLVRIGLKICLLYTSDAADE